MKNLKFFITLIAFMCSVGATLQAQCIEVAPFIEQECFTMEVVKHQDGQYNHYDIKITKPKRGTEVHVCDDSGVHYEICYASLCEYTWSYLTPESDDCYHRDIRCQATGPCQEYDSCVVIISGGTMCFPDEEG